MESQKVHSAFRITLFWPLVEKLQELTLVAVIVNVYEVEVIISRSTFGAELLERMNHQQLCKPKPN